MKYYHDYDYKIVKYYHLLKLLFEYCHIVICFHILVHLWRLSEFRNFHMNGVKQNRYLHNYQDFSNRIYVEHISAMIVMNKVLYQLDINSLDFDKIVVCYDRHQLFCIVFVTSCRQQTDH